MVKIGSRCYTKQTGDLGLATVIGIIKSKRYNEMVLPSTFNPAKFLVDKWNSLYPNWRQKEILVLEFDQPQKPLSYAEHKDVEQSENINVSSYKYIPLTFFAQVPIDDVEFL